MKLTTIWRSEEKKSEITSSGNMIHFNITDNMNNNQFENLDKINNFLNKFDFPKLTQKETEILKRQKLLFKK